MPPKNGGICFCTSMNVTFQQAQMLVHALLSNHILCLGKYLSKPQSQKKPDHSFETANYLFGGNPKKKKFLTKR
jgi:hypothetical protein